MRKERAATLLERRLKAANQTIAAQKQQLLDTQELAASLNEQLLDAQSLLATLDEGGSK